MSIEQVNNAGWNTVDSWVINKIDLDIDLAAKSRPQMLADVIAAYARKVYLGPWPMVLTVYLDGRWVKMNRYEDGRYEIVGVIDG